ncbi:MAG: RNA polymerase sporulation sigma factor SigK [Clostridia bacterium]|nr:RNA polymerase sporulation sigma factor SigK [Clostridia bacterium]
MFEGLFLLLKDMLLFSSFVSPNNSFPRPLSAEKEKEYVERAVKGDKEARDVLIKHNLRLVVHIVKKYNNYPDVDELISVGSIGLIKAVNTFTPEKGTQLATYASRCIENEILMTLRAGKKRRGDVSLYDAVGVDKEGNEITLIDMLHTDEDGIFDEVERSMINEKLMDIVKKVLDTREYEIISLRYGLTGGKPLTQREVAVLHDISRSYVSRIEKKAIEKIRRVAKREELYL